LKDFIELSEDSRTLRAKALHGSTALGEGI
jgi:hypothetical protein